MWGKSKLLFLIIILTYSYTCTYGQENLSIHGVIKDASTKEVIPFASIYIPGKTIGATSDFDGKFNIVIPYNKNDILAFSFIGYYDYKIAIKDIKPKKHLRIWLNPQITKLQEVTILPTENPAHPILRKIIKNRKRNNPNNNKNIEYDKYSKNLIILKDLKPSFSKKKIFKNYNNLFIKQKNGNLSIPIYFSEKLTSNIKQDKPKFENSQTLTENTKNIAFLDIDEIKGYREELCKQTNIYNNQLTIFSRSFISPIASTGLIYYKYYLTDSIQTNKGIVYKINFKPKNKKDLVFKGYFLVNKNTWAINEISAKISASANINFLNSLDLFYTYNPIDSTSTYYKERNINAEFTYSKIKDKTKNASTILIQENSSYSEVSRINKTIKPDQFSWEKYNINKDFNNLTPVNITELTHLERKSSSVIDSLNNTWFIKASDKVYNTILSGYIDIGMLGIGPYLEMIKRNKVEGIRTNLGLRTNEKLSKNYMLYGSLGYGTKDRKFKYSASILYKFKSEKRRTINFTAKEDIIRLSDNGSIYKIKENMLSSAKDNIIAAFAKRKGDENLYAEKSYTLNYSNEWNKNFTTKLTIINKLLSSTKYGKLLSNGKENKLLINEIRIDNRFSFHEKIMDKYVRRYYLGTSYPIIHLGINLGHYKFNHKTGRYLKFQSTIKQYINIGLMKFKYIAELGHTLGSAPFPLLEVHRSNQTRGFSRFSFNLMENCEYINSTYISVMPELHLNGLILNKIPLIKHLNLREVISAKAAWGYLDKKQTEIMDIPEYSSGLSKPYCEVGIGIENIFKYFRLDAVWRLTDKDKINVHKFGVFLSLYFSI
jgi:hypothetical protein